MNSTQTNTYIHKGVNFSVGPEAINDALECYGVDIVHLVKNAIDRMLYVAEKETDDFGVKVQLLNPRCEPDE